jgi:hypothetical protein
LNLLPGKRTHHKNNIPYIANSNLRLATKLIKNNIIVAVDLRADEALDLPKQANSTFENKPPVRSP